MKCPMTKEETAVVNALSDQAFSLLSGAVGTAKGIIAMTRVSECNKASAVLHAMLNVSLLTALDHRIKHGEMKEVTNFATMKANPAVLKTLIGDVTEILVAELRRIDPKHDYLVNLFETEKANTEEGGTEQGA